MTTKHRILLSAFNKLRRYKQINELEILPRGILNRIEGMIEDADSYAVYGYGSKSFREMNPTAIEIVQDCGDLGIQFCNLIFGIGWAKCAEDPDCEREKWKKLEQWAIAA